MNDQPKCSANTSTDSVRYATSNRSQTPIFNTQQIVTNNNGNSVNIGIGSNRNSLKENISNRSSMDVSTCSYNSYNTLIIHPDDALHGPMNRFACEHQQLIQDSSAAKKDRPYSYGEQGMQEITEIPDDYLNQSHVLKHLAKEIKIPSNRRMAASREVNSDEREPPKYEQWMLSVSEESEQNKNKVKSKSQPDLTK